MRRLTGKPHPTQHGGRVVQAINDFIAGEWAGGVRVPLKRGCEGLTGGRERYEN